MTLTRISAVLLCLVAVFVLTACGVPPTGVVQAGEPATRMPSPLYVYFLAGDTSVGVPRAPSGVIDVATAVRLVFAGPTHAEAEKVGTELPRLTKAPEVVADGLMIRIRLPDGTAPLSPLAQQQLVCTVEGVIPFGAPATAPSGESSAAGRAAAGFGRMRPLPAVSVSGGSWQVVLGPGVCPAYGG